jgi:solute carrier family 13 (sodium-dependent dicarboxylate transporter), member 2/3/5
VAWPSQPRAVTVVLALATAAWLVTRLDDTLVALAAAVTLAVTGGISTDELFGTLGDPTIWLLIGSCLIAAGLSASGLAERAAARIIGGSRSVRGLVHRTTVALTLTAFAMPATSGRAALAIPVFRTMGRSVPTRSLQVALSLLFPAVILLSAFASILGAGAHLIAANLIAASTGVEISFLMWVALGAPVAIATSHLAAELILFGFLSNEDRRRPMRPVAEAIRTQHSAAHGSRLAPREWRALVTLAVVVALWLTEPLHGLNPALVAIIGGVVAMFPVIGTTTPHSALDAVPWTLLLFLAATLALGGALVGSGAADRITAAALGMLSGGSPVVTLLAVVIVSAAAHLVVQSRSARSTVLVPMVLVTATAVGLNPVAAALASTAAAGFCLTLSSSAKPVAMFSRVDDVATFDRRTLLVFSTLLAPFVVGVILLAARWLWPPLGIPLTTP